MRYNYTEDKDEEFESEAHALLWSCGMKATKPRLEIIESLFKEKKPLSIADIYAGIKSKVDLATMYRVLEQLCKVGKVTKIQNPKNNSFMYEIRYGRSHHHHITCTTCGEMEDVIGCDADDLNTSARAHLKKFKSIQSHSLEFFGLCRKCENK